MVPVFFLLTTDTVGDGGVVQSKKKFIKENPKKWHFFNVCIMVASKSTPVSTYAIVFPVLCIYWCLFLRCLFLPIISTLFSVHLLRLGPSDSLPCVSLLKAQLCMPVMNSHRTPRVLLTFYSITLTCFLPLDNESKGKKPCLIIHQCISTHWHNARHGKYSASSPTTTSSPTLSHTMYNETSFYRMPIDINKSYIATVSHQCYNKWNDVIWGTAI